MKNKKKKAFTLVELLAVIVILAVILVIAIPQIMNVIKSARISSIKDSAMLIAEQAEKDYLSQQVLNKDYNETSIPCEDVAKLNDDYDSCNITYNNGIATIKLKGKDGGKFSGITCKGTKDNMSCKEKVQLEGYTDAVEYFTNLCDNTTGCNDASNTSGLIKTNGTELRYRGSNPNNYVTFNDEVAGWRIVGIFDGRVKLVRKTALGGYSWDTSVSNVNNGYGINEWSQSDLMNELNGDYLNSSLSSDKIWYNGSNNQKTGTFNKNRVLKTSAQELIEKATWYTSGVPISISLTLSDAYIAERGTQGKMCTSGDLCNDTVTRTTSWIGKVGLIYPSDYGYASSNSNCQTGIRTNSNCNNNWMTRYGWTITPAPSSGSSKNVWTASSNSIYNRTTSEAYDVHPSVYLISGIQVKGTGTSGDPFVFAE